jgi:hypothetical protein
VIKSLIKREKELLLRLLVLVLWWCTSCWCFDLVGRFHNKSIDEGSWTIDADTKSSSILWNRIPPHPLTMVGSRQFPLSKRPPHAEQKVLICVQKCNRKYM